MVEFCLFSPVGARVGDRLVEITAARPCQVLAMLLINHGRPVSSDRLIDEIWSDEPPRTAENSVQRFVSDLRTTLGEEAGSRIKRAGDGYVLEIGAEEADFLRFEDLADRGRRELARSALAAAHLLSSALDLWDGGIRTDLLDLPSVATELARLDERRMQALEDRIDADLRLGRHAATAPEAAGLALKSPLRERLVELAVRSLIGANRAFDALDVIRTHRAALSEELGVEVSSEIAALEDGLVGARSAVDKPDDRWWVRFAYMPMEFGVGQPREHARLAREYAEEALARDPTNLRARQILSLVLMEYDRDWAAAEHQLRVALDLAAGDPRPRNWLATLLALEGRVDEALIEARRVLENDPGAFVPNYALAIVLYLGRRLDEAADQAKVVIQLFPAESIAYFGRAWIEVARGSIDEAREFVRAGRELDPGDLLLAALEPLVTAQSGDTETAIAQLDALGARQRRGELGHMLLTAGYIGLGEHDTAIRHLEAADRRREGGLVYVPTAPMFDPLRSDPRFERLVRRISRRVPSA